MYKLNLFQRKMAALDAALTGHPIEECEKATAKWSEVNFTLFEFAFAPERWYMHETGVGFSWEIGRFHLTRNALGIVRYNFENPENQALIKEIEEFIMFCLEEVRRF